MNRQQEEAKAYLSQAFLIDRRIHSKIEQVENLSSLATSVTAAWSDMPGSGTQSGDRMEKAVISIVDLEAEISEDICGLVDTKREIAHAIKAVDNPEYQTVLELRYLCFERWEQIAVEMGYSIDNAFHVHRRALNMIKLPKKE